jgi:hypothetical protein
MKGNDTMAPPRKDYTGQIHGDFIVLHEVEPTTGLDGRKQYQWLLQCTKCGAKMVLQGRYISNNQHRLCDNCIAQSPEMLEAAQKLADVFNQAFPDENVTSERVINAHIKIRGFVEV